jgi:hypothetical protein
MTVINRTVLAALVLVSLSGPAIAQTTVTNADIQRLQDDVFLADRDIQQMRNGATDGRSTALRQELDELRDEVIYLKVKLRKERSLARSEFADVRDRIADVRARARGDASGPYSIAPAAPAAPAGRNTATGGRNTINVAGAVEVPTGTEIDVRIQQALNSGTALVEDRFEATTLADTIVNGRTVIPAGALMRGVVTAVEPATRTNRTSRMTVSFDQVTVGGRAFPIRGTVTEAIEAGGVKSELPRTGVGAGVGAVIGGILGGTKGAILGGVIGAGGTIAATEGKQVELPQGTVLRVRFDSPAQITPAR